MHGEVDPGDVVAGLVEWERALGRRWRGVGWIWFRPTFHMRCGVVVMEEVRPAGEAEGAEGGARQAGWWMTEVRGERWGVGRGMRLAPLPISREEMGAGPEEIRQIGGEIRAVLQGGQGAQWIVLDGCSFEVQWRGERRQGHLSQPGEGAARALVRRICAEAERRAGWEVTRIAFADLRGYLPDRC